VTKRRKRCPSWDSNHIPSAIRAEDDNHAITMSILTQKKTGLLEGDSVMLKCETRRETVCKLDFNVFCSTGHIEMNRAVRNNLRVRIGDIPDRTFRPPETSGSLSEPAGKINVSGRKAPEITGSWKQYSGPECLLA
jgi:hypothetical protein